MRGVVQVGNYVLGVLVVGLFAFQMFWVLANETPPSYAGAAWAMGLTGFLLLAGLIQLGRFALNMFNSPGEMVLSLALLAMGMLVDLFVWGSVVFGFRMPHLLPLWIVAGYWLAFYGEVVIRAVMKQRQPGGVLHSNHVPDHVRIRQLEDQLRQVQAGQPGRVAPSGNFPGMVNLPGNGRTVTAKQNRTTSDIP